VSHRDELPLSTRLEYERPNIHKEVVNPILEDQNYKEVVNPNLEDQNYLSILRSAKKKINIVRTRTNSHDVHSETRHWTTPKTPWDERICHLCDTKWVEDEKHVFLDFPAYTH
jgi:hypothetical protein